MPLHRGTRGRLRGRLDVGRHFGVWPAGDCGGDRRRRVGCEVGLDVGAAEEVAQQAVSRSPCHMLSPLTQKS